MKIQKIMMMDCEECGQGVGEEELSQTLLGFDVVGLFPALKSQNTGEIIRKRIMKSKMMINGFSWRQGARYIAMNKHLIGEMENIWELLPWTKIGATVSMKNRALNSKKEKLEENWCFSPVEPTEDQTREIVAKVAEIGVRTLFDNFCY